MGHPACSGLSETGEGKNNNKQRQQIKYNKSTTTTTNKPGTGGPPRAWLDLCTPVGLTHANAPNVGDSSFFSLRVCVRANQIQNSSNNKQQQKNKTFNNKKIKRK